MASLHQISQKQCDKGQVPAILPIPSHHKPTGAKMSGPAGVDPNSTRDRASSSSTLSRSSKNLRSRVSQGSRRSDLGVTSPSVPEETVTTPQTSCDPPDGRPEPGSAREGSEDADGGSAGPGGETSHAGGGRHSSGRPLHSVTGDESLARQGGDASEAGPGGSHLFLPNLTQFLLAQLIWFLCQNLCHSGRKFERSSSVEGVSQVVI